MYPTALDEVLMSKFAIGENVEKAADDHEECIVVAPSQQLAAIFGTPSIWKGTFAVENMLSN